MDFSKDFSSPSNDSQLTLVNGSEHNTTQLVFTAWNRVLSTSLLKDGRPLYKVATNDPAFVKTVISDAITGETLAKINRPSFSLTAARGKVTVGSGESVKIKHWLREGKLDSGWLVSFMTSNVCWNSILINHRDKWTMTTVYGEVIWKYDPKLRLVVRRTMAFIRTPPNRESFSCIWRAI